MSSIDKRNGSTNGTDLLINYYTNISINHIYRKSIVEAKMFLFSNKYPSLETRKTRVCGFCC